MTKTPHASVSLDLDNLWSYLKIHGDQGWEDRPSYLGVFVPFALELLDELGLEITFFVVGADAALEANRPVLRSIATAGHEIGNHSFEHESWLQQYSKAQLEMEISRSQENIEAATGVLPTGFRGPGFSWSPTLLEVLADRGFLYDASTLPTYLGPLARAYYFRTTNLSPEERVQRADLFGRFSDGFRPSGPYYWQVSKNSRILEIPVTTVPIFKTPFHLSYLLYLSRISTVAAELYLRIAILLCRLTRVEPSFLLHPLDLIGGDQVQELEFFPGMDVSTDKKSAFFRRVFKILDRSFDLHPMGKQAQALLSRGDLPTRDPRKGF